MGLLSAGFGCGTAVEGSTLSFFVWPGASELGPLDDESDEPSCFFTWPGGTAGVTSDPCAGGGAAGGVSSFFLAWPGGTTGGVRAGTVASSFFFAWPGGTVDVESCFGTSLALGSAGGVAAGVS